jgi:signal transduction histidine kinase
MPVPAPRRATTLLLLLVGGTIGLALLIAREAWQASRSRDATVARTLRDYVGFAAVELGARARDGLDRRLRSLFEPVAGSRAASPFDRLAPAAALAPAGDSLLNCAGGGADPARRYLRLDLRDASLEATGSALPAAEQRQLADSLAALARRGDSRIGLFPLSVGGSGVVMAASVKYLQVGPFAPSAVPIAVYAMVACASAFGEPVVRQAFAARPLLPGSATQGVSNDSLLALALIGPAGEVSYRSAADGVPDLTRAVRLELPVSLTAEISLRQRAVQNLTLPASGSTHLPALLTLLGLAGALAGVALRQLRREQELARLRSDFVSSVSHELRTPLAQILLSGETLALGRTRNDGEQRRAAAAIVQEARRLIRLVENVLQFARLERRVRALDPRPVVLGEALRGIVTPWLDAQPPGAVRLRTEFDEAAIARVDAGALRQIALNLLDNAVKYGPRGQVLTIRVERGADEVRLIVDDQGPGVPEEDREKIWQPFVRGANPSGHESGGAGLGLAVVRELVALERGRCEVARAPGGGGRFIVSWPAGEPTHDGAAA